jgi:N-terminal domain of toast_rack, DUF2154
MIKSGDSQMTRVLLALTTISTIGLSGCVVNLDHGGSVQHDTQSIDLDKSEMARVEIKLGAGELQVDGGSPKLMDADFEYNIASWKPIVRYEPSSFRSQLRIEQPGGVHGGSHVDYKWNLRLNDKLPLDFDMDLGAGEARMNLGSMNLRSVQVNVGVGEVTLDLRGNPTRDYAVTVNGGVGHARIYLPAGVGVVADAKGGIGDVNVRGLEKRGGHWVNPAHENAPVTIRLDIKGGIGQIEIIAE